VNVPGPSGKIILKIETWPPSNSNQAQGVSLSFTFTDKNALDDREKVKTFLAGKMAAGPPSAPNSGLSSAPSKSLAESDDNKLKEEEIKARQSLLLKDRALAKLHRDWVVQGGLMTEEEFWETRKVS
jgi:hypothetical protein